MYLSTDMAINLDEFSEIVDTIKFIFSIKPESIPFMSNVGFRVQGNNVNYKSNVELVINRMIKSLNISNLSIDSIEVYGKKIELTLSYKGQSEVIEL
jgi:hypothetical protein